MGLLDEFDIRLRALGTAAREAGYDPRIVSGYRSNDDQARAIDQVSRKVNGRPATIMEFSRGIPGYAAPVGGSNHQKGEAADWGTGPALDWVRQNAARFGVKFPQGLARTDPVHSELDQNAMGPFQDPRDRDNLQVAAFETTQKPTRMALGGPPAPQQSPPTPQPNGAPPMAEQQQGGFGGLLSAFANGMQSPLFMSGAAMYNAGAEGRNVGGGFLAGGQAASEATKNQFMQDKLRREQDIEQRQQQMWDQVTSGQTPEWASGLPQNTLQLARALGPVAGPKLISEMVVKQASANSYGKQGTIVQGGDGRFYSIQFSENGQRKIEPLEIGQQGAMPGVPGAPQPGVTGQPVPPVAGQQPQAPVSLSPSRGVDVVGSKIIDKATGRPVRDAGPDLADRKTQEEVGEAKGKFIAALPKLQMAQTALAAKNELVKEEIDRALKEVNWSTTGIVGAMSRGIPGTPGFKLNQLIQTIKANIGFDQLNNMRAESPTGGALGAIAVQELTYLQSVLGSLEQAQDGETITLNLNRLKKAMDGAAERRAAALQMDLQRFGTGGGQPAAPAAGGSWGIRKLGQ